MLSRIRLLIEIDFFISVPSVIRLVETSGFYAILFG